MHYVYLLQSESHSAQRYTGLTGDLKARLAKHNEGGVPHTSKFRPWRIETYIAFSTREQASCFEHYLKLGSGRAFANRHLWPRMTDGAYGLTGVRHSRNSRAGVIAKDPHLSLPEDGLIA
jgi:predicted GIY-YIG superfamily endonuclease